MAGCVLVDEVPAAKPGQLVSPEAALRVRGTDHPYVSRGGCKLEAALDGFGIDPAGRICLDVGASTGGFTDCLLQRGAARIYALDVGYGQLDQKLARDERVVVVDRTNVRHLQPEQVPEAVSLVTIDVSFISLAIVLPALDAFLAPGGAVVALVKPQFEAGREAVGKGGIVRDPAWHERAVEAVCAAGEALGWHYAGRLDSPITGAKGNREFLLLFRKPRRKS